MSLTDDLELAKKAARKGVEVIREYRIKGIKINQKGFHDLVTDADIAAEKAILEIIQKENPNDHILAEESADYDSIHSDRTWIIDPIDGTTNFANDFPIYCVSVALWIDKQAAVGVVIEVNRDEEFSAIRGEGAWLNGDLIRVSDTSNPENGFVATGFPYNDLSLVDPYLDLFRIFMKDLQGIRRPGAASFDLCCVACGRFDGFYEYSLHIWDVAAASLIITEAGGVVTDWNGEGGWPFGQRIIAGNKDIHNYLLKQILHVVPDDARQNVG